MDRRRITKIAAKTAVFLAVIFGLSFFMLRRSAPYKFAIAFIDADPTIAAYLGPIKKARIGLSGSADANKASYGKSSGYAEYEIHVVGEKDNGVVVLKLTKAGGFWSVESGSLDLADGRVIELTTSTGGAGK